MTSVRATLAAALGGSYVNDFPNNGRLQKVMVQAEASARMQDEDVLKLTVPNGSGQAVPLSSFVKANWVPGVEQSLRFNGYPAVQMSTQVGSGSTGQAMAEIEKMVKDLGGGYSVEWQGQSREEAKGSSQKLMLYGFAALSVFLVLAALYESWSIPFAVLLVAPLGLFGVVFGVASRNLFNNSIGIPVAFANDIYFTVGMITVMGLSAKNAILIIEFAKDLQAEGKSALAAALEAAHLRFRPILMTSFAFILGVVPLYFASGASSGSQSAIGTTVFWGMTIGTLLSVFLVPVFYAVVRGLFKPTKHELEVAAANAHLHSESHQDSDSHNP